MIARREAVFDKASKVWVHPAGDVLILVGDARTLFNEIIRALKRAEVRWAGGQADVSDHSLQGLMALAAFASFRMTT